MAHVIHSYDAAARLPENQSELQGQYISVLQGKNALILLDNAAGREQVEPLLPPAGCCMLITSRHKFALKGMKAIDLNVLSPEDSRSLLLANADRIGDNADKLAELCGRLPLALRNAAYLLAERVDLDVTEYIDRLKDARKRLDLVDASFDLSYNLLTPDLRDKWSMLSIFPADFDRAGGAAVWDADLEQAVDDLGELVRWSLVNFYPSATLPKAVSITLIWPVCLLILILIPEPESTDNCVMPQYYKDLLFAADDLYLEGGKVSSQVWCSSIGNGLISGQVSNGRRAKWQQGDQPRARAKAFHLCMVTMQMQVHQSETDVLHPRDNIRWLEASLRAAQALRDRQAEGAHMGNLGMA